MQYSSLKYANILFTATRDANEKDITLIISNFISLLLRNKHLNYVSKIIYDFEKLCDEQSGRKVVEIVTKNMPNESINKKISSFYVDNLKASELNISNVISNNMIGGIILKTDEEVIDGSLDRKISMMRKLIVTG